MPDSNRLEMALYDIEADVRVLELLADAEDEIDGFALYNIPSEAGYFLRRTLNADESARTAARDRLTRKIAEAIDAFRNM